MDLNQYKCELEKRLGKEVPKSCYICELDKNFTKMFIDPSVDDVLWYFNVSGSSEFLKYMDVFWLCPNHYEMINNCKINKNNVKFYKERVKYFEFNNLNNYRKMIRRLKRTNKKFRWLIFKVKIKIKIDIFVCRLLRFIYRLLGSILGFK